MSEHQNFESKGLTGTEDGLAPWEIAAVITSCLIVEWAVVPFAGGRRMVVAIPIMLALGFMIYSHYYRGEALQAIGFRWDNFLAACRILLLPTLGALTVIVLIGWWFGGSALNWRRLGPRFLLLPFWALFQQYALQGFINRRVQMILGKGFKAWLMVGLIFGLVHLPNPLLTLFTCLGGMIWAKVYQGQPNLFALAISHSLASLALSLALPPNSINSFRVGLKYFG